MRLQDAGLSGADDATVLEWCAREGRLLVTHDVRAMTKFAYERVERGQRVPGIFEVSRRLPVGPAIEDLMLLAECSVEGEWE